MTNLEKEMLAVHETIIRHMKSDIKGFKMLHDRIMLLGDAVGYSWVDPNKDSGKWVKKKEKKK